MLLFALGYYMIVHVTWIRAGDIDNLPEAPFTIIPIVSVFLKLIGETLAINFLVTAVGAGVLMWFAGDISYEIRNLVPVLGVLPYLGGGSSFVAGLLLMLAGALAGFLSLVLFYLLSEAIVVLADIATSTRGARQALDAIVAGQAALPGTASLAFAPPEPARAQESRYCHGCGSLIGAGSQYCEKCGKLAPVSS